MISAAATTHKDLDWLRRNIPDDAHCVVVDITSAWGVMLAGLIYGLIEALTTAYLGSTYTQIVSFSMIIAMLVVMPNGLLGRAALKKV